MVERQWEADIVRTGHRRYEFTRRGVSMCPERPGMAGLCVHRSRGGSSVHRAERSIRGGQGRGWREHVLKPRQCLEITVEGHLGQEIHGLRRIVDHEMIVLQVAVVAR